MSSSIAAAPSSNKPSKLNTAGSGSECAVTFEVTPFEQSRAPRIVFGAGAVERAGALAKQLGATRVLIVTDNGVAGAGHAERVRQLLEAAGLTVIVFDHVHENPTTADVDACLAAAKDADIDLFVGLGGGSSLDTAKGCNFLLTNSGRMADYWGIGKAVKPMLPLIAIPTTAGTGSECQSFALIADEKTHQKMACGDPKATAAVAILDPALTLTQPRTVAACTGIDAITHAIETFVTTKRNALSMMYSAQSLTLTMPNLQAVLRNGDDLTARGAMLWGAALAGLAIENSMLGAAHAAANPLTAHFGVPHGAAVGLMLPHVMRFNAQHESVRRAYTQLASHLGRHPNDADTLIQAVEQTLDIAQTPRDLAAAGVDISQIDTLAAEAAQQWTAQFNPRPITQTDFAQLYRAAQTQ